MDNYGCANIGSRICRLLVLIVILANQGRLYDFVPDRTNTQEGTRFAIFPNGDDGFSSQPILQGRRYFFGRRALNHLGSVLVMFFVVIEEFSQIFLDSGIFDLVDLAADVLGIMLLGNLGGADGG